MTVAQGTVVRMTAYIGDERIQGSVLDAKPGRPAAALIGMNLDAVLRRFAERSEIRGEVIDWPSLAITAGDDGVNLLLHAEVDAGRTVERRTRPPAGSGSQSNLLAVQAENARLRAALDVAEARIEGASATIRTAQPTPFLRRVYMTLQGEVPEPSGRGT